MSCESRVGKDSPRIIGRCRIFAKTRFELRSIVMNKDMSARRFNVYVVGLDRQVLRNRRFSAENPQYNPAKPCVYVGMTALSPKERFACHKRGYKACKYVRDYGLYLKPRHYRKLNPMTYEEAVAMERELARRLRNRGYAVWQQ